VELPHPIAADYVVGMNKNGKPQCLDRFVYRPEPFLVEIGPVDVRADLDAMKPELLDSFTLANAKRCVVHRQRAQTSEASRAIAHGLRDRVVLGPNDFVTELRVGPVIKEKRRRSQDLGRDAVVHEILPPERNVIEARANRSIRAFRRDYEDLTVVTCQDRRSIARSIASEAIEDARRQKMAVGIDA
jgi:hypothetical protein